MSSSTDGFGAVAAMVQTTPDPTRWRRFFMVTIATAAGLAAAIYLFIAIVDPWDMLPLSPRWQRTPMSTNQRYIYAALARSPKFDSLVVGSSTVRLLQPTALNAALGGRFANLSMNAATPYEQSRILGLFGQTHNEIGTAMVGVDSRWCDEDVPKYFSRWEFPEWMYRVGQWRNYAHAFSLYALQESFPQLIYLTGLRHARFTLDGYANFLPDDSRYDADRAAARLGAPPTGEPAEEVLRDDPSLHLPALGILSGMLSSLPAGSRKIVVLTPLYLGDRPVPGSAAARPLAACKFRIVELARRIPDTQVVDFMIDSPITRDPKNYWDPLHYRVDIAGRIVADLAAAAKSPDTASPDFRLLVR